eukprot:TRINITY_DN12992_c0_g1_i1.p1 TRINITY_DN12992_c0_g1~~TRINITY_DN12992_c0_g1_i1.p1  ORF type:complete len:1121 (+),score=232.44 TRINITY_DN12992_c0_g1_i1:178-3540(+)
MAKWTCQVCTMDNAMADAECEACGAARPQQASRSRDRDAYASNASQPCSERSRTGTDPMETRYDQRHDQHPSGSGGSCGSFVPAPGGGGGGFNPPTAAGGLSPTGPLPPTGTLGSGSFTGANGPPVGTMGSGALGQACGASPTHSHRSNLGMTQSMPMAHGGASPLSPKLPVHAQTMVPGSMGGGSACSGAMGLNQTQNLSRSRSHASNATSMGAGQAGRTVSGGYPGGGTSMGAPMAPGGRPGAYGMPTANSLPAPGRPNGGVSSPGGVSFNAAASGARVAGGSAGAGGSAAGGARGPGPAGCVRLVGFLMGATNLRNMDLGIMPGDVSDPFAVVRLGRYKQSKSGKTKKAKEFVPGMQEFQTEVIDNDLNPVWTTNNFDFTFEHEEDHVLRIEVFNCNTWSAHDSLGFMEVDLLRDIQPGQTRHFKEQLQDGDEGRLELELRLLTTDQVRHGDTGGAPPHLVQHAKNPNAAATRDFDLNAFGQFSAERSMAKAVRAREQHKVQNKVPLPSFTGFGREAFEAPPPKADTAPVGELRHRLEYSSQACHLGQYDYNGDPTYYPKQEICDKGMWQADPFYGWRTRTEHPEAQAQLGNGAAPCGGRAVLADRNDGAQDLQRWSKDPFSGWLKHGRDGRPEFGTDGKTRAAEQARAMLALPSFHDVPTKRFEDHREYSKQHEVRTRARPYEEEDIGDPYEGHHTKWKDDAFYGWLPGRGPPNEQKHLMHRPLEAARLVQCPSFSEQAINGIRGRGIGVLKVWINGANVEYDPNSGGTGQPSACVKMKVGSRNGQQQERVTDIVRETNTPEWHSSAFIFELMDVNDVLTLECWDLIGQQEYGQHVQSFFLGRFTLPVALVLKEFEEGMMQHGSNRTVKVVRNLEGVRNGRIDFDWLYEPYDSDAARQVILAAERLHPDQQGRPKPQLMSQPSMDARHQHMQMAVGRTVSNRSMGGGATSVQTPRSGQQLGARMASHQSFHSGGGDDSRSFVQLGVLSVRVIAAYNLVNMDSGMFGDVSDPYVTMKLSSQTDKQRKRTITIPNNLNPTWNSSPFLFPIKSVDELLQLEVFDDDQKALISSEDDFIGRMTIPLVQFINNPNTPVRIRDALHDIEHGELEVEIGFSPG